MKTFDEATALQPLTEGRYGADVTADWAQGKACFGGIVSALGLRAMARHVPEERPLRSVSVDFAAPLAPGRVEVVVEVVRSGRALTHATARVEQDGAVCALLLGVYGAPRQSNLRVPAPPRPDVPAADALPVFPYVERITPVFTRHFNYRWSSGAVPFTSAREPILHGWVRHAEPTQLDAAAVLALVDAWPAPVLPLLDKPAPASSVTWMVNLSALPPPGAVATDAWWFFDADTNTAAGGYADVNGRLWAPDGTLVATSRQLVAEFS